MQIEHQKTNTIFISIYFSFGNVHLQVLCGSKIGRLIGQRFVLTRVLFFSTSSSNTFFKAFNWSIMLFGREGRGTGIALSLQTVDCTVEC